MQNFNETNYTEQQILSAWRELGNNGAGYDIERKDLAQYELVARFDGGMEVYKQFGCLIIVGDWNGLLAADIPCEGAFNHF
jgi:hypothetical protein